MHDAPASEPNLPRCAVASPQTLTLEPGKYAYCTCGLSEDGVFCDGAHKNTTFRPRLFDITEQPETLTLCRCKHTGNAPFCDGSHKALV
jgi:CDGSH iron-sulfur domain-containing protein 3